MPLLDDISRDLDWRESEIASIRLLLRRRDLPEKQTQALLRAAWGLLYAHYEGFCKNCLTLFFAEISKRGIICGDLPLATREFALRGAIRHLRSLSNADLVTEVIRFPHTHLQTNPSFPEVETGSNLWPDTLIELMGLADLNTHEVEKHSSKLSTLVARRNSIAHGEQNFVAEFDYYHGYEKAVYDVMYDIAIQVDERIRKAPYR